MFSYGVRELRFLNLSTVLDFSYVIILVDCIYFSIYCSLWIWYQEIRSALKIKCMNPLAWRYYYIFIYIYSKETHHPIITTWGPWCEQSRSTRSSIMWGFEFTPKSLRYMVHYKQHCIKPWTTYIILGSQNPYISRYTVFFFCPKTRTPCTYLDWRAFIGVP